MKLIDLGPAELSTVRRFLPSALVPGGSSRIGARSEDERRDQNIAALLGECAGSILLTGDIDGFVEHREKQAENPLKSTGASDLLGLPVDFKVSRWKFFRADPYRHHCWVRPREYHQDFYYIQGLAEWGPGKARVSWLGWCPASMLALRKDEKGEERWEIGAANMHTDFEDLRFVLGLAKSKGRPTRDWLCEKCQDHYRRRGKTTCTFCQNLDRQAHEAV